MTKTLLQRAPDEYSLKAMLTAFPDLFTPMLALGQDAVGLGKGNIRTGKDVRPRTSAYIWQPYVPVGEAGVVAGESDTGKSFLIAKFMVEVQGGGSFPADAKRSGRSSRPTKQGAVMVIQRENDEALTLLPRFKALGGNPDELILPAEAWSFSPEDDIDSFARLAYYIIVGGVRLTFIDPITGYIGGDMNSAKDVRTILERLQIIARFTDSTILFVAHLNKKVDVPVKHRVMGSHEFISTPRTALLVSADPDAQGENIHGAFVHHIKSNRSMKGGPFGFRLEGNLEEDGVLAFKWTEVDQGITAEALAKLANGDLKDIPSKPAQVRESILKELIAAAGPVPISHLKTMVVENLRRWNPEDAEKVMQNNWQRGTEQLAAMGIAKVNLAKLDDGGFEESAIDVGIWGYRHIKQIGDDGKPWDELADVEF